MTLQAPCMNSWLGLAGLNFTAIWMIFSRCRQTNRFIHRFNVLRPISKAPEKKEHSVQFTERKRSRSNTHTQRTKKTTTTAKLKIGKSIYLHRDSKSFHRFLPLILLHLTILHFGVVCVCFFFVLYSYFLTTLNQFGFENFGFSINRVRWLYSNKFHFCFNTMVFVVFVCARANEWMCDKSGTNEKHFLRFHCVWLIRGSDAYNAYINVW